MLKELVRIKKRIVIFGLVRKKEILVLYLV